MTEKQLRAIVERRRKTHFWGRDYFITPRLVDTVFGDGKQLMFFASMDHRPNYYVVRVGSNADVSHDFHEQTDAIEDAIIDQFGRVETIKDYFPMFPENPSGTHWGVIRHSEILWPRKQKPVAALDRSQEAK